MTTESEPTYDARQYWNSRDYKTSARLHLQHWIYQSQLGYLLHPSISQSLQKKPDLKVADVACGNGAWLLEVARQVPSTAQLYGFDITDSNYPAKEWLPENVTLTGSFDAISSAPLPKELEGAFDVVHIRAFTSIVKDNKVDPLIKNLLSMLKPGGYLQWDETNQNKTVARAPNESVEKKSCDQLLGLLSMMGKMVSKLFTDWLENLPTILEGHGMKVLDHQTFQWRKELLKPWTENLLTVHEELAMHIPAAKDAGPNPKLTREMYQALFAGVLKETTAGVTMAAEGVTILAQKAG